MLLECVEDSEIRAALAAAPFDIGGVFHLWPTQARPSVSAMAPEDWRAAVSEDLRSLYTMLSEIGAGLATMTGGFVVAGSCMGGAFGFDELLCGSPSAAGAAGLLKSAVKEWEGMTLRAVDFDPATPVETMVQLLIDEAGRPGGAVEIGWRDGLRFELSAAPRPFVYDAQQAVAGLGPQDVVLVTGGARGITARIVKHLASHHKARFVLMGSTGVEEAVPEDLAGLTDARVLRGKLVAACKASGRSMVPARIEAETRQILRANEIAETLAYVRAAGCEVEYVTADVRDGDGFHAAVQDIYDRYGRIDVAIHGAGVIDDKLIADKTLESFERVVRTKTDSAFSLVRALRPDSLKSLVFFASVAGRFGNRGQGDYGAANEVVSKMARDLDARWPGQVIAISWGPWDSGGMVTAEIKAQFQRLGIEAIPPECGVAALEVELQQNAKSAPEVVWGRGPWEQDAARHLKVAE